MLVLLTLEINLLSRINISVIKRCLCMTLTHVFNNHSFDVTGPELDKLRLDNTTLRKCIKQINLSCNLEG